jgi:small GTP-binding protein
MEQKTFVFIGSQNSGKTTLIRKMMGNTRPIQRTIGVDFESRIVELFNKTYKLAVYDTSGEMYYHSFLKNYIDKADMVVLVVDATTDTLYSIGKYMDVVGSKPLSVIINKIDQQKHTITKEDIQIHYPSDIFYFECSATNNINIRDTLNTMLNNSSFHNVYTYEDLKPRSSDLQPQSSCTIN